MPNKYRDGLRFRRANEPAGRWSRIGGTRRRYELSQQDDARRVVALARLDKLLDGRAYPADFWACVKAADDAWESGELDAWINWPEGTRTREG